MRHLHARTKSDAGTAGAFAVADEDNVMDMVVVAVHFGFGPLLLMSEAKGRRFSAYCCSLPTNGVPPAYQNQITFF